MTSQKENLDLLRLLSAIESALLVSRIDLPDSLWERTETHCERLEKEVPWHPEFSRREAVGWNERLEL